MEKLDRELKIIENAIERLRNLECPIHRIDQLKDIDSYAKIILDNVDTIREEVKS